MVKKGLSVGVVGAGIGGLTAATLLLRKGFDVTVFEKEAFVGGRALSFDPSSQDLAEYRKLLSKFNMSLPFSEPDWDTILSKKLLSGYTLDLGFHAIGGGAASNINQVFSELKDHVDMLESKLGYIMEQDFNYPFLSMFDKIRILPDILRLVLSGESTMKKLDNVSMMETIERYGKGKMRLVLEVFSRVITTVNDLSRISTGETFRSLKNLLSGSNPVGYPVGGLKSISLKLADFIRQNGGIIRLNTPVKKIVVDENRVKGVLTDEGEQGFDVVVSNVLVQNLFKFVDKKSFPDSYVNNVESLTGTGSLCAYYSLDKVDPRLIGKTFLFIERGVGVEGDDAVGMIDFMTASPYSGLAPEHGFLVQSYVICTPDEAKNKEVLLRLREVLDKNLWRLIPDFRERLRWAVYPAVWHLDGVAKTIDNVKPGVKTPVNGLYLVGDCVKAPGIGVNCAVNSARMLQTML
ncbi:MAG: NAD(P)/FAD-dependent oxidoreductase [Thermoplasmata archaeon]|nr:MAG: NAD(P)/FAD-dependent oxidoreductase [Thermoplasmata archaeon]